MMKKTCQSMWMSRIAIAIISISGILSTACGQGPLANPPLLRPPENMTIAEDHVSINNNTIYSKNVFPRQCREEFHHMEKALFSFVFPNSERRYSGIPVLTDQLNNSMQIIVPDNLLHANLHILDSQGRVWIDTTTDNIQIDVDVSSWPSGYYDVVVFNQIRLCQGTFNKL